MITAADYNWLKSQGLSKCEPFSHPPSYRCSGNACSFAPIGQAHCFSGNREHLGLGAIQDLLLWCRPSTVVRFVVSVIVDAVYRHAHWPSAHVSQKVLIGSKPSFTDTNSPASISRERWICCDRAAPNHCPPDPVFSRDVRAGFSVCSVKGSDRLFSDASTTGYESLRKVSSCSDVLLSTRALTKPTYRPGLFLGEANNRQSAERHSAKVYPWSSCCSYFSLERWVLA